MTIGSLFGRQTTIEGYELLAIFIAAGNNW